MGTNGKIRHAHVVSVREATLQHHVPCCFFDTRAQTPRDLAIDNDDGLEEDRIAVGCHGDAVNTHTHTHTHTRD